MVRYDNERDDYSGYNHGEEPQQTSHTPNSLLAEELFRRDHALPTAGHAVSGAFGSALANVATYPLDVISTRLKVQRHALAQRAQRAELQRKQKGGGRKRRSSSSSESDVQGIFNVSAKQKEAYTKYVEESDDGMKVVETWEYNYDEDELYDGHFDAIRKIYEREGVVGFYHGVGWDTMGNVIGGFWYFMAYTLLRKQRLSIMGAAHKGGPLPISEELGIGIAAAALSKLFSAPLSNIVTRKQTSAMLYPNAKPPSFVDIYQDIMREKGITGFWSGYSASLLLTLNPSITYIMYEMSKPHYVDFKGGSMNKFDTFFLAALCRAAATTLTYPMNVVRIRSQMEDGGDDLVIEDTWEAPSTSRSGKSVRAEKIHHKKQSDARYYRSLKQASGIVELISEIIRREGISALYVGLKGTLAKSFFSHSVTMLIKEQVHHYILKLYFFVLDAYNHAEHGSFRDASLERTISAKNKANRTVDRSKQKLIAAKDKVGHVGERIKEKAHLTSEGRHSGRENRTEEEMYEERFSEQRAPERTTAIREERITSTGGGPPQRTFRETRQQSGNQTSSRDRLERERTEVSRQGPLERSTAVTTMVRGGAPAAAAVGQLVGTGPLSSGKNLAKVAVWRDRVAEDTAVERALAASEAYRSSLTLEDQKDAARLQNGNHTNAVGKYSRDPSLASGQSYRSSGARSSMLVHPSSSVRERLTGDWAEATRGRLAPGRSEVEMNGGEVARIDRGDKKAWK